MNNKTLSDYNNLNYKDQPSEDKELNVLFSTTGEIPHLESDLDAIWETQINPNLSSHNQSKRWFFKVAASLLILISVSAAIYSVIQNSDNLIQYTAISDYELTLGDGSTVFLQQGTTIFYNENFKEEREVRIQGQAYFDVVKSDNPFQVEMIHGDIEVVGTSFNTISNERESKVFVTSGIVKYSVSGKTLALTKGDRASFDYSKNQISLENDVSENALYWINKQLKYDNEPLERIVDDIQEHFGVYVEVDDPSILNCKITGSFKDKTATEMIESVCAVLNLKYSKSSNKFLIKGKGC